MDDPTKTVKVWRLAAILKYPSSSNSEPPARGYVDGRVRSRWETMRCGTVPPAGWPDAACRARPAQGKCRLGYVSGLMSPSLLGSCHFPQWTSEFTRKLVRNSLGCEVYAFSGVAGHMSPLLELYAHSADFVAGNVEYIDEARLH